MKTCETCRFWSERVAYCMGGGPMNALCLAKDGPHSSKYTTGRQSCPKWREATCGAVDDPSGEAAMIYAAEEQLN